MWKGNNTTHYLGDFLNVLINYLQVLGWYQIFLAWGRTEACLGWRWRTWPRRGWGSCWRELGRQHLLFGSGFTKKTAHSSTGCSKQLFLFFCWFLFCGHKDFEEWAIRDSLIEIVLVWGIIVNSSYFFGGFFFHRRLRCVFVYFFGCQGGMSTPPPEEWH